MKYGMLCTPFMSILLSGNLEAQGEKMTLKVTSSVFKEKGTIPAVYTCDGTNDSPPLTWERGPEGTQSYTLICDDPDAPKGTWDHWILFNIPAQVTSIVTKGSVPGAKNGKNSWGKKGYGGPCPPSGTHRYIFTIYALDTVLDLPDMSTKSEILQAMKDHIVAQGSLTGLYARTSKE
jgi:Raf kinase inhibitor-like YbhB/YbcL family protein